MRACITLLLCAALMACDLPAQTSTNAPPKTPAPDCTLCELMLMLGVVAVGGAVVICIYSKNGKCCAKHKLVLYKDNSDGNWVPIATNVVMVCTNKIDAFADIINKGDLINRYRVEDAGLVP